MNHLVIANRFRVPRTEPLFLRIALRGANNCESYVRGDSHESVARHDFSFLRIESPDQRAENGASDPSKCFHSALNKVFRPKSGIPP